MITSHENMTNVLVTDLKYRHLSKLIRFLDQRRCWYDLGKVVFRNDIRSKCALDTFQNGGDSPATRFIESLVKRMPDITVNKFYDIAIGLRRRDISGYIESLGKDYVFARLVDLTPEQTRRIVMFLDKNIPGIHDWRMFADTFNYTNSEIGALRQSPQRAQGPSECLFALLRSERPFNHFTRHLEMLPLRRLTSNEVLTL